MAKILIGTCAWTDPTLIAAGTFYPAAAKSPEDRLRYYATQFPIVEVDSTYYGIPNAVTPRLWADRTPDEFTFDVKAFRLFTGHQTPLQVIQKDIRVELEPIAKGKKTIYLKDVPQAIKDELWRQFTSALEPLRATGKLGVIIFQIAPWMMPGSEAQQLIEEANRYLAGYEVAVEFRNALWFSERNLDRTKRMLEEQNLCYVAVDGPQGFPNSVPPIALVTGPVAVVRFHGRNAGTWETKGPSAADRFDHYYTEGELEEWVPRVKAMAEEAREVHLLINTNNSDQGPVNGRKLGDLLAQLHLL